MKQFVDESKPIYQQIAESIEDDILKEGIREGDQVPSTNQFAKHYQINPATAAKGINLLVDEGILYKKRGIGMFVAAGARKAIEEKRRQNFFREYILPLLEEAQKLHLDSQAVIRMIEETKGGAAQ
ncbi:MAG: GntR family transcriptional regulator [Bacillota bacterium]|nr:GntR family transcriptional regulator [Bacillota bacterium]MDW7677791.1 GntR family transcriptional regulator [Bacillota bacterium]